MRERYAHGARDCPRPQPHRRKQSRLRGFHFDQGPELELLKGLWRKTQPGRQQECLVSRDLSINKAVLINK